MGWNDRLDTTIPCDECTDCVEDCTDHEEADACATCMRLPCMCDEMYENWKDQREE